MLPPNLRLFILRFHLQKSLLLDAEDWLVVAVFLLLLTIPPGFIHLTVLCVMGSYSFDETFLKQNLAI